MDKVLAALFPTCSLRAEVLDELDTPAHLFLDGLHVVFDALDFGDKACVLSLEVLDAGLELDNFLVEGLLLLLHASFLSLQLCKFVSERLDGVEDL